MDQIVLTEEEDKLTKYCEEFCPVYDAITRYNHCNRHRINCPTEMCSSVTNAYVLNRREKMAKMQQEAK